VTDDVGSLDVESITRFIAKCATRALKVPGYERREKTYVSPCFEPVAKEDTVKNTSMVG